MHRYQLTAASYIAAHPFSAALLERCTPAFGNLFEAIKRQEISHDDDPAYAQQILNAIVRSNERAFTLAKQKSRGKIDAAYALMMCFDRANVRQKPRSPLVVL
jgi:phage terminase large subunit-like protein